jgi:hypothetical protein
MKLTEVCADFLEDLSCSGGNYCGESHVSDLSYDRRLKLYERRGKYTSSGQLKDAETNGNDLSGSSASGGSDNVPNNVDS